MDFRRFAVPHKTEDDAYKAGQDCALNGATEQNCHFAYFARPELTKAWEKGKAATPKGKP